MRTWRNLVVVAAVAAFGLSACGGDDDDSSGGGDGSGEFCDLARQADTASDDIGAAIETGDPEEIERVFEDAIADFEAAVDAAPEAIRDVAEQVTDNAGELRDRLEELDWDIVAFSQDEQALELAAQGEGANTDLDQFLEDECDIPADDEGEDGTVPENAGSEPDSSALEETLAEQFEETLGLTAEQSECLANILVDADLDASALNPNSPEAEAIREECDIDLSDLLGG